MKDIVITTGDGRELKGLYQWDINQKICISGIETSPLPEIHFWACRLSKALVVPTKAYGDMVVADVPNILLQVAEPITIFIYKKTGEDGHRTSDAIRCPVCARPQPEEYEYEDNIEYTSWVELTEEARELLDQIDEIVDSMSGVADQALAYATSAGNSADEANTAKLASELAQRKAEDAQAAAELAQGKAEDAKEAAEVLLESIPEDYDELLDKVDAFEENLILVQSTQPVSEDNRLWVVTDSGEEISVPTYSEFAELDAEVNTKAPAIIETAGPAAVVTITDGAEDMPLKTLVVDIPVTHGGSGDPSPENVRPFTARTARRVTRTGANLWGGDRWFDSGAGTFNRDARTVKSTTWQTLPQITGVKYKPHTAYTLILTMTSTAAHGYPGYVWHYTDGTTVALNDTHIGSVKGTVAFVSNPNKTLLGIDRSSYSGTKTFYVDESGIFEGALTAADFQPYQGQVVDVDWTDTAGDVYAGTLTLNADGSAELAALPHYASYAGETLVGPWLSSMDVYAEGATPTTGAEVVDLGGAATVYQLTVEQIKALAGGNNIWSNAGEVTAVYPADTKSYVDAQTAELSGEIDALTDDVDALESDVTDTQSMIATVETSETASKNYAIGDLLVLGGTLYKVTAAIPAGATITPGSNVTQTTVEAQIAAGGGGGGSDWTDLGTVTVTESTIYVGFNVPTTAKEIYLEYLIYRVSDTSASYVWVGSGSTDNNETANRIQLAANSVFAYGACNVSIGYDYVSSIAIAGTKTSIPTGHFSANSQTSWLSNGAKINFDLTGTFGVKVPTGIDAGSKVSLRYR